MADAGQRGSEFSRVLLMEVVPTHFSVLQMGNSFKYAHTKNYYIEF